MWKRGSAADPYPGPRRGRASTRAAISGVLVAAVVLAADARRSPAKEHAAGCPEMPAMLGRLRASLLLASIQRTRGSSMAAYEVLRSNAASLAEDRGVDSCGIVPDIFRRSLRRAQSSPTAMEASLALDIGFAAALAIALSGRMPVDDVEVKTLDVPESVNYGEGCPDIFRITQKLAGAAETLSARVASVLDDLKKNSRCARLRIALEAATGSRLADAVESVVLDEADATPTSPVARCPELPVVLERLTAAVALGAPLYNKEDYEGCRRLYAFTARTLTKSVIPRGRCPVVRAELEAAIKESEVAATASDAAWALRRGFDRIADALSPQQRQQEKQQEP